MIPLVLTPPPTPEETRLESAKEELLAAGEAFGLAVSGKGANVDTTRRLFQACKKLTEAKSAVCALDIQFSKVNVEGGR